jgi:hypothetical protein
MLNDMFDTRMRTNSDLSAALCIVCEGGKIATYQCIVDAGATATVDCLKEATEEGYDDIMQHMLTRRTSGHILIYRLLTFLSLFTFHYSSAEE